MSTVLLTERLVLRHMEQRDFDQLYALFNDPEVMRYYPGLKSREETQAWIDTTLGHYTAYRHGLFVLEHIDTGEFLGQAGVVRADWDDRLDFEVGYMLARKAWGRGYATEAARACRDYAFAHFHPDRVVSFITPENARSQRVAQRNGMKILNRIRHPRLHCEIDVWGIRAGDMR